MSKKKGEIETKTTVNKKKVKEKEVSAKKSKKENKLKEIPTIPEIKKARKAELIQFCEKLGLDTEGRVVELRERLIDFVEGEEEIEVIEEGYEVKRKPVLIDEIKSLLRKRKTIKNKKPEFKRQEWFRYRRLGESWRRPRGHHSKMRRHYKYRIKVPSKGYRAPKKVRGLHPSGFQEVVVYNTSDLEKIDPERQAARIGHSVGTKKRIGIEEKADELGIRVLNRGGQQ